MITAIHYKSFKSLIDTELPLEPLTILIGTNSSGKTNTLEGLNVLAALTSGAEISQAFASQEIRGDAKNSTPFGKDEFALGCSFLSPLADYGKLCRYEISIKQFVVPLINSERLLIGSLDSANLYRKPPLFTTKDSPDVQTQSIHVEVDNFSKGGYKPGFVFFARIPVLFQVMSRISTDSRMRKYKESAQVIENHKSVTDRLMKSLSSILIIDPKPDVIRDSGYVSMDIKHMDKSGANLSGVLYNLFTDENKKQAIVKLLQELPEHSIIGIDFHKTDRKEVRLYVTEKFQNQEFQVPLELLSDGTVRLLAVLASALSLDEGGLMVIEELDTSLHPSKVARLLNLLENIAKDKKIRLLVTSHNPTLMDAVPVKNMSAVVLCYREKVTGFSKLIRVIDIPESPGLLARESLGSLVSKRALEKVLKTQKEREKLKDQLYLEWKKEMWKDEVA